MGFPVITVVMPVFNAEKHLTDCVESILNQSFTQWELVAIDDGSTDKSFEILQSFNDSRIRVFRNGRNLGAGATRNRIIEKAMGNIIALQDSDDLMHPERLELQHRALIENTHADLVGCSVVRLNNSGFISGVRVHSATELKIFDLLFLRGGPVHATLMARKSWFQRNPYPEHMTRGEDKVMIVNAVANSDFKYVMLEQPLYLYREDSSLQREKLLEAYRIERSMLAGYVPYKAQRYPYLIYSLLKTAVTSTYNVRAVTARINWRRS